MEYIALVNEMLLMMSGDIESNPGPSTALNLKTVFNALHSVSHKWSDIGLQLDVPISQLKIIEIDTTGAEKRLCDMLDYWMNNAFDPLPSWKVLVNALKAPAVGESKLAKELEYKYCSREYQSSCDVQSSVNTSKAMYEEMCVSHTGSRRCVELTTSAPIQSSSFISPSSNGSEKPPFGCGCGKCTFFTFMVTGCQKLLPSASSFPYLDPSKLTPEQQQVLRRRLRTESKRINMQFQYLVSTTLISLEKQQVTVRRFLPHLMTFGADEPVLKDSQAPVFDQRLGDLEKAGDLLEVFMGLKDYMSFFNYHLIEHIINVLGTEEDKAELKKYKTNFQQYAKRRVYECPPQFGPVSIVGHADVFVIIDSQYEKYTLAEIEDFKQELSDLLGVSSNVVLRLSWIPKLTFQVPSFLKEEIFSLSREKPRALTDEGVYQFQKDKPSQQGVDKKSHDNDDDSGVGPSMSTTTKSITFSEGPLEREPKELEKVQGHTEEASIYELNRAVLNGQLEAVKYLITEKSCNPACRGQHDLTPLHLASQQGHYDIVRYLVIEQQIDPQCEDEYESTPLHKACRGGHQAVVELLAAELEKYNPITQFINELTDKWNSTPLHAAVKNGHLNIVNFFISEKKCDPNLPGQYDRTPLHYAAEFGHLHIVKYLTDEQGCKLSSVDDQNETPLHRAARMGHMDIVKFLTMDKQCDPMCRDSNQYTPLHYAAQNGHIYVVKFLVLEMHCNPTCRNAHNATALHLAVGKGHLDILQFFMSYMNCDPNIPGQEGGTPLHYAAESGHLHIVKYLTDEQGCNPSCLDDLNRTPLHLAAIQGHLHIVQFFAVEKQCDPMCRDSNQSTPLHNAAANGHINIVKFLTIDMHCASTSKNTHNHTALHLAVLNGHLDIVQFFICDQNCNPNLPVHPPHHKFDTEYPEVCFFGDTLHEIVTAEGQVVQWEEIGITLDIPPQAVSEQAVDVFVHPCLSGPFQLPEGIDLASPLYLVGPALKFKREIKLSLQHFINLKTPKDCREMTFLSAQSTPSYIGSEPTYQLREIKIQKGIFTVGSQVATIFLKHFCIVGSGKKRLHPREGDPDTEDPPKKVKAHVGNNNYSVRLYWDWHLLSGGHQTNFAVFAVCSCDSLHIQNLDKLMEQQFGKEPTITKYEPMCLSGDMVSLLVPKNVSGWKISADRTTEISKRQLEHGRFSGYPPTIRLTISHEPPSHDQIVHMETVCKLEVLGLTEVVEFKLPLSEESVRPVALMNSAGPSAREVLTERHLNFLLDVLKSAATVWLTIGLKLGFEYSELKIIENTATLIVEGPTGYLREMLVRWMKWSHPNHPLPTIENLVHALRSAGEESLALNLEETIGKNVVQACPRPLPENSSMLIQKPASIYGSTILHLAAACGHLCIVKYFTDKQGCNPSCLDSLNQTPLHRAAMKGHMDIVKFLTVEKHCNPMLEDCEHNTPLHLAVREGHLQIVSFFIEELKCPLDIVERTI